MTQFFRVVVARAYGFPEGAMAIKIGEVYSEYEKHYIVFPKECFVFDHEDHDMIEPEIPKEPNPSPADTPLRPVTEENVEDAKSTEPEVFDVGEKVVKRRRRKEPKN